MGKREYLSGRQWRQAMGAGNRGRQWGQAIGAGNEGRQWGQAMGAGNGGRQWGQALGNEREERKEMQEWDKQENRAFRSSFFIRLHVSAYLRTMPACLLGGLFAAALAT